MSRRLLGALTIATLLAASVVASIGSPSAGAAGVGTFSIANAAGPEGTGGSETLDFVVSISLPNITEVSVDYTTTDGTAKAPLDYATTTDTLTIPAGETSGVIQIPLVTDTFGEPNESFTVTLSNPETGMTLADGSATGTIQNDDTPARTFSVNNVSHPEGDVGGSNATFTVTLSGTSSLETTVDYTTSAVTATADVDYGTTSGTLTFEPGDTSETFDVSVAGDTTDEANETFLVTLSNPDDANIGAGGTGTGTITDDDAAPTVTVEDAAVGEGNSGTTTLTFTAELSAASGQVATIDFATGVGALNPATAGVDYESKSGTVTFVPGDTSEPITVNVTGDTLDEPNETFALNLSNPLNLQSSDTSAVGTITDDEDQPAVSVIDTSAAEGNAGNTVKDVTVTLSVPSGQTVTVDYDAAEGTADAPDDFNATNGTVTFNPGQTSKTFPVTLKGDVLAEPDETIVLTLSSPTNATISDGSGVLTILDDDATPTLSIDDRTVLEGDTGSSTATFTVTLSGASGDEVTVNASTADGTATAGEDYAPLSNEVVTIPAGQTTATVEVNAFGDEVDEANETATLNLSGAQNAVVADASGLLTITDDDDGPAISINNVTAQEGTGAGTTTFTFTVSLSAPSEQTATVDYGTQNGSAVSPGDYIATSGTLTFTPGDTSETVAVTIVRDAFAETAETFTVALTSPTNASLADATGLGTINNDDGPAASLSIANDTALESEDAVFTITLSQPAQQDVTFDLTTAPDEATANADYDPTGASKTITTGNTSTTFTVPIVDDTIDEPTETFDVTLSNVRNASVADGSAVGTITDDDDTPAISIEDVSAGESSGTATIDLTLSNARSVAVTVDYATANGTAGSGDYTSVSDTATFAAGTTSTSIEVDITSDTVDEPNETVIITLSDPSNATIGDGEGVLTIIDDDGAPTLSIGDVTVTEGDAGTTNASFTVTLSAPAENTVTVDAGTSAGTATTTDFTTTSGTVTFVPSDTSETFVVPVVGDTKAEIDETFSVTLSSPSQATISDGTGTGTIDEDDGGGTFTPVTPARILDTRTGLGRGGLTTKLGAGQTIVVDVTGVGGVPATGVGAVVINTTVTQPSTTSFLAVTPNGGSSTSNLNFVKDQTVPNLVTVPVGTGGAVRMYNQAGSTHVVGDVVGWYAADTSTTPGSHYQGLTPARILDTRNGTGRGGSTAKMGPGQSITLDVTGVGGVPASGVAGVVINMTVTAPTAPSFLAVTPSGGNTTSNLNYVPNLTVANLVSVPVGPDGNIRIFNNAGSTHVIGDVVGWYTTPNTLTASVFEPLNPARILDTRTGVGRGGVVAKVGPGQTITVDVTGVGGVPAADVGAVVLNTTATAPTSSGYLSVTPNGGSSTSTLNFRSGATVPNLVIVAVGTGGSVRIFNSTGSTHVLADVVGWFTVPAT